MYSGPFHLSFSIDQHPSSSFVCSIFKFIVESDIVGLSHVSVIEINVDWILSG